MRVYFDRKFSSINIDYVGYRLEKKFFAINVRLWITLKLI